MQNNQNYNNQQPQPKLQLSQAGVVRNETAIIQGTVVYSSIVKKRLPYNSEYSRFKAVPIYSITLLDPKITRTSGANQGMNLKNYLENVDNGNHSFFTFSNNSDYAGHTGFTVTSKGKQAPLIFDESGQYTGGQPADRVLKAELGQQTVRIMVQTMQFQNAPSLSLVLNAVLVNFTNIQYYMPGQGSASLSDFGIQANPNAQAMPTLSQDQINARNAVFQQEENQAQAQNANNNNQQYQNNNQATQQQPQMNNATPQPQQQAPQATNNQQPMNNQFTNNQSVNNQQGFNQQPQQNVQPQAQQNQFNQQQQNVQQQAPQQNQDRSFTQKQINPANQSNNVFNQASNNQDQIVNNPNNISEDDLPF